MAKTHSFAPAKVNLTMHVTGRRGDGYHLLDSLVVFADVGDRVSVEEAEGLSLSVTGPLAQGVPTDARNSILAAANFLSQSNLAFTLDKHLPAAAGIGGGTSDAAAALRAMAALRELPLPDDVLPLGADVPVSMIAKPARMRGIGEAVVPLTGVPLLHSVLVNPGCSVPTPAVFKRLQTPDNAPMDAVIPGFDTAGRFIDWLGDQRNDLQAPAIEAAPQIQTVLTALNGLPGARLCRMSGSGATCFALFETAEVAKAAVNQIAATHPEWWVKQAKLH